ncbi:MAG: DUF6503 family protein [Gilvibacter sp.]
MKIVLTIALGFFLIACNQTQKTTPEESSETTETTQIVENTTIEAFPKSIGPLFEAHGGIAQWRKMNNLCFEMIKESGNEVVTTDLNSRQTIIEHKDWTIGYDGVQVWLDQKVADAYGGNARFYHNLYFYFYAMPFIVSDPGINYGQLMDPLEVEGKRYRGAKISYGDGIGDSPDDEYIIYSDRETGKMTWLAYTVTFRSGEKSDNFRYIKYADWQEVNGLLLPKTLTWYNVEDGKPTTPRNSVSFDKVTATETVLDATMFKMPDGATIAPR